MKKYIGLIGRRSELKLLDRLYGVNNVFVLLTGMEHVGKSTLLRYFVRNKPALLFSAQEVADELNRREFCAQLYRHFDQPIPQMPSGAPDWRELMDIYAETEEDGRKVLILDNLEHLVRADSGFQKNLMQIWERVLRPKGVMLICVIRTGSVLINMEKSDSPIIKGAGLKMDLEPVNFLAMLRDYPYRSFEELVSLYAITGGIPLYWYFFTDSPALIDQLGVVREQMLTHTGWFYNEPINLLNSEVYEPGEYVSILQSIALGRDTLQSISDFLKFKPKKVQEILQNLEALGFVKPRYSIAEKRPVLGKARFVIAQPLFDFWFTFVYPNRGELQLGKTLNAYERIQKNFEPYAEYWFVEISKEIFKASLNNKIQNFTVDKIGPYWDKKGNLIDIVAIDETHKKIFFGECIYANTVATLPEFEEFIDECRDLKDLSKYRNYEHLFGLFVTKKPEPALISKALHTDNVIVFEGKTIYRKKTQGEGIFITSEEENLPLDPPETSTKEKS